MYQYDSYDQRLVDERATQFEGQVQRRLSGETTELEFKPLRLQNGLYMQLHAYMLRVAIPYGLLNAKQVRMLAHIARTYDRGYCHVTTRQNVQYNWPKLGDVPNILADLASVQMHAIQTSGNCIRNTTSDPFAGVAPDELEDPRPYCELIRQWSTFHPEFAFLPRKFKIAVTGTPTHDRAAIRYHDIGVRLVPRPADAGESQGDGVGFEIWAGGGLGRTPVVGKCIRAFLEYEDLLSYLEAILRVYNQHGRRDNKYKARIKILVNEMGQERFTEAVEAEWVRIKDGAMRLERAEIDRIRAHFAPPEYRTLPKLDVAALALRGDRAQAHWLRNNVAAHRQDGYSAVLVSLKTPGVPPGDISDTQLDKLADIADRYSFGRVVATHAQNLVLPDVESAQLPQLYEELNACGLGAPNGGLLTDMICCPGLDYCALANARSIPVALRLLEHFDNLDYLEDVGPCSLKMSGCINACGHHHVANIGILGIDKHGEEAYQITLGGHESDEATIGKVLGPAFAPDAIVPAVDAILRCYLATRTSPDETFLACYRRVGPQPFKEAAYASH